MSFEKETVMLLYLIEDENFLSQQQEVASNLLHMRAIGRGKRDPEEVRRVIITGRNIILRTINFYTGKKSPFSTEDRIKLLKKTYEKTVFGKVEPEKISRKNLPRLDKLATSSSIVEHVIGNIYCSTNIARKIISGESPKTIRNSLISKLENFIRVHELTNGEIENYPFSKRYKIARGPADIAKILYAFELKFVDPLKIYERTKNLDIIYGRYGIQLEVKETRILSDVGSRIFCRRHHKNIYNSRDPKPPTHFATIYAFFDVYPQLKENYPEIYKNINDNVFSNKITYIS